MYRLECLVANCFATFGAWSCCGCCCRMLCGLERVLVCCLAADQLGTPASNRWTCNPERNRLYPRRTIHGLRFNFLDTSSLVLPVYATVYRIGSHRRRSQRLV